jgi:multidrug resistance efflux pump
MNRLNSALVTIATLAVIGSVAAYWIVHRDKLKPPAAKPAAAAVQTKAISESDLNLITLTPDAETRLAIKTEKLATRGTRRVRQFGGEVMLPPGAAITVSAPFAGKLKAKATLTPGQAIKKGDVAFTLLPLLTNEARTNLVTALVDAESQIKTAEVQVKAAMVALDRAKQLIAANAGSGKTLTDAQAAMDTAQKTLEAATARRDLLSRVVQGKEEAGAMSLNIEAPLSGMIRNVYASDEIVPSGAALFEVIDSRAVWIRVPVYAGELDEVDFDKPAKLGMLGSRPDELKTIAVPIRVLPTATAANATRDLIYQTENINDAWTPGQRVQVAVEQKAEEPRPVIAWGAIVFDINGGAWVYEQTAARQYVRRRVEVLRVDDGKAILATAPPVGATIVTQGVAELFGKEMGFGK